MAPKRVFLLSNWSTWVQTELLCTHKKLYTCLNRTTFTPPHWGPVRCLSACAKVVELPGFLWPRAASTEIPHCRALACKCSSAPVSFHQCRVLVSGGPQVMHSVTELRIKGGGINWHSDTVLVRSSRVTLAADCKSCEVFFLCYYHGSGFSF